MVSTLALVRELHDLERQAPATPIELYVNSDGGDLVAGLALVDTMRQITAPVHNLRLADFVLEGPAAIGLKRTDPEGVPQRMYTSDAYESASGAEEHEEAAAATASPTTHSM